MAELGLRAAKLALVATLAGLAAPAAAGLEDELGRSETQVWSAPFHIREGVTVEGAALPARLEGLGYRRVHARPGEPGEYFWGRDVFWVHRRPHRWNGRDHAAALVGLDLERQTGRILRIRQESGREGPVWLEPELLSESLDGDRAVRRPVRLDELPEHVWRVVLAAEDARFFDHPGIDARSIARAALSNVRRGGVVQGGSTITQQLIKNRDLTPRRTFGRKLSEAVRALALEADYTKQEILQAYLNTVYFGHVEGLAVHGLGAAAEAYFSKDASELALGEAALLAALVQGPNRLAPQRHPDRARTRRDWVLGRMEELGWADAGTVASAKRRDLGLRLSAPRRLAPVHLLTWVAEEVAELAPARLDEGRGFLVETTLDPYLQELAERAIGRQLASLATKDRHELSAALVALDAGTGAVLAYVGGDPRAGSDRFDRVRRAKRQPGSTIKPLVLLEAFERCAEHEPLYPASRVDDGPLTLELASGAWSPQNADEEFHGIIDLRTALAESRNVPFVRIARWCGFEATAERLRDAGLDLPADPPPSFALGAVETTPLALARAYTVLAHEGRSLEPFALARVERSGGRALGSGEPTERRVVQASTAYLVRDLMRTAVETGTAKAGRLEGTEVAAKTGTSSEQRDAWFAGVAGEVVTVVWVGLDGGGPLGLTGSAAAGPIWREFMAAAVGTAPEAPSETPRNVVEAWIDPDSGLLVRRGRGDAKLELFRADVLPPRNRRWRFDKQVPVVE